MTTAQQFNTILYNKIKERTKLVKAGSKLPYISFQSARKIGTEYGFDARPVTLSLIELNNKGLIRTVVDTSSKKSRKQKRIVRYVSV